MVSSKFSLDWPFADCNFGDLVNGHGHSLVQSRPEKDVVNSGFGKFAVAFHLHVF